jgi:catechol 2,3-dioxygenase-like lactoylglutathione lyase family enzyme
MGLEYNPENCVISVGVTDYGRSLGWYRDVLGFELVYELEEYGWCELKTPFAFNIGLGQSETVEQGNITPTFGVRDIDAAIAHLRAHDVKVEDWHEIAEMVRLSTFYDPDGTPWMLAQTLDGAEAKVDRGAGA